jgi:deoxycytidine triphosphate deaminase
MNRSPKTPDVLYGQITTSNYQGQGLKLFEASFGCSRAAGRSREVPFILEHGQIVGRLVYEKMLARPDTLYGSGIGSNYQAQGLKLSKHFKV